MFIHRRLRIHEKPLEDVVEDVHDDAVASHLRELCLGYSYGEKFVYLAVIHVHQPKQFPRREPADADALDASVPLAVLHDVLQHSHLSVASNRLGDMAGTVMAGGDGGGIALTVAVEQDLLFDVVLHIASLLGCHAVGHIHGMAVCHDAFTEGASLSNSPPW